MRLRKCCVWIAATVLMCLFAGQASAASLVGDQVTVLMRATDSYVIGSLSPFVVAGGGPEATFSMVNPFASQFWFVDIEASRITITANIPGGIAEFANGSAQFEFSSLDWVGMPTAILVGATIQTTGGGSPPFAGQGPLPTISSLGDHALTMNFTNYVWASNSVVTIDLITDQDLSAPEPATATLVLLTLGGMMMRRRRSGLRQRII